MSESAIETHGPSLEQILWRAMDRWEERPALVDAEEFAAHIAGVFGGEVPAEAWVERFFAGPDKLHQKPPADLAEAIVRATKERLHVYEFDLQRLDYVIVEDEKKVVVVSDFGQFALENDDLTRRAIESAVLPKGSESKGEPRGYLVRKSGELVGIDVKKVAASLQQFVVRQVSAPAVEKAGARLAPFSPRKRAMSEAREEQALRQDPRARQALPLRVGPREDKPVQKGPPAVAQTALFLLLPDGQLAGIGSANRWREMVGSASRSGTEVTSAQSVTIRAGHVVAIINRDGSFTLPGSAGERALARGEAIAAVRSDAAPVRVLNDDAIDDALALGARVVPALQQGNRFWIQPESVFKPDVPERTVAAGQPLRLGEITGDPWADWALTGGGEMPLDAMMALRGRTRHALRAALDRAGDLSIPPELADRVRGSRAQLEIAGAPVVGFRSADGTVIVARPQGAIRLAALDRPEGSLDPIDLPLPAPGSVDLVPRSGAVPATALASLQLALEHTAMAGGYKLPLGRLDSAPDALDVGNAMRLDAGDPRRTSVQLAGPHFLGGVGQTAQLVLSMPFPNQGEIHVGNDLAQALQSYLSAPVMPAGTGPLLKLRDGRPALGPEDLPLDWNALHSHAALKAQDAVIMLDLPAVQPLVSGSPSTAGLPFLLRRALANTADWVPGPGAPMPESIRALALGGPFDQFLPGEMAVEGPVFRPPNPGEQEIVIPLPLWAEMGRSRISETDRIMASPRAPAGYQPPLGVYRLVIPPGGPFDMTGGAPAGTTDIVDLGGPVGLELLARSSGGVTATSLGGRQFLGRVALDDGESVVTRRGRIPIGPGSDLSDGAGAPALVSSPAGSASPSSGLAIAGAANSALALSTELDSRLPGRPSNLDQSNAGTSSDDNSDFSARAQAAGQADAASSQDHHSGSDQTLVVAGQRGAMSGAQVGAAAGQASQASSQAGSAASSAASEQSSDTPSFITGLRPGMWSGHHRRNTAGYQTWSYGSARQDLPQTLGGVDLMSLSQPVYPSLPTALRFRYVGAPLWWSSGTGPGGSADDSTPAAHALRSGLRAATSAASIWRSIFIASPQWGGAPADGAGQDANAAGMIGLSRRFEALAAGTLVAGGAETPSGAFIATTGSGRAGAVDASAAARAKAGSVEMSIVAAIPPRPPPIESMSSSGASVAHARGKEGGAPQAQREHKEAADAVTASKIEGSVDAIAQRIYHRIRRRIESDRERFGG